MAQKYHFNYLSLDQTAAKEVFLDNSTSLNINRHSKMVKNYCDSSCKRHPEFDPRKLIKFGYNLGFRKCQICGYFKTTLVNCPCCNRRLRCSMRQKNHPNRIKRKVYVEY
jgi:hypothetical protein